MSRHPAWRLAALLWSCLLVTGLCRADDPVVVPLLSDAGFSRGVRVISPAQQRFSPHREATGRSLTVCLPQRDCSLQPLWHLQQWGSAQDIATAADSPSGWLLQDSAGRLQKRLQFSDGGVLLEMDGLGEFAARSESGVPQYLPDLRRAWPHWLLSQQLQSDRLSRSRQLLLAGEIRLLADEPQRSAGYDPSVHAARLLLAITVRNRLNGDYFWLTLPLYDDRQTFSDFGCQKCLDEGERCYTPQHLTDNGVWRCPEDRVGEQWWKNEKPGTARMIFRVPSRVFVHGDVRRGEWVLVSGDLLPYVQAGIEAVRQRENGRRFPASPFFYELGLFAIGWEITGFNHVAAQLRGWRLDAVQ